jgi:outer membrane protein
MAQGDGPKTLQDCINIAILNNIEIKQTELGVVQAKTAREQSIARLFPNINGGSSLNYNVGRSINPFTNLYEERPVTSQNIFLNGNLDLFQGMQKTNSIRRSQVEIEANQQSLEATRNNVTLQVVNAYMQILFNNEIAQNNQFRIETANLQIERTERLVHAGAAPMSNLLDLKAQRATDELSLVNAQNQLELAHLNLAQLLQLAPGQRINIVVPDLADPTLDPYPVEVRELYSSALNLPAVKAAESQVRLSEYDIMIARGGRMPSLSLGGGIFTNYSSVAPSMIVRPGSSVTTLRDPNPIGYVEEGGVRTNNVYRDVSVPTEFLENTYTNQLDFNLRRAVSLNLNIPIFNGWQVRTQVANARIANENAKYAAIGAKNRVIQEVEQAYTNVRGAAQRYQATLIQVQSLQEAFRMTEQRFNVGAVNAVDYNLARNNLNQAETDLIQAKYDYIFKTKILDFYQGKPLTF